MNQIQDNGTRIEFETGAKREGKEGKGRFDLIPSYPLLRLAKHYQAGAVGKGARNWELGIPMSSYLDSLERHIANWKDGDRTEDHLAAAAWNLFGLIWTEEQVRRRTLPPALNDLEEVFCRENYTKRDAAETITRP